MNKEKTKIEIISDEIKKRKEEILTRPEELEDLYFGNLWPDSQESD